jgi:hypothetical protein
MIIDNHYKEYTKKHVLTKRVNPKLFERVLKEKMTSTEIQNIFEHLISSIKLVLTRQDDWTLHLDFFGRFEHKQNTTIFFSSSQVYIPKTKEPKPRTLIEKSTSRSKAMKTLRKRKNKQIEGMIFKLVNLPSLLEEEQDYMTRKKYSKSKRIRQKSFARKPSMIDPSNLQNSTLRSHRTMILGRKGCLRSKRLKPLKLLKAKVGMNQEEINQNMLRIKKQEENRVVEEFSRTLARPAGIQGECLSVSGRIASNYTPLSRYLFIDYEKKRIMYLKLKDSQEKENKVKNNLNSFFMMRPKNVVIKNDDFMYPTKEEIDEFHSLKLKCNLAKNNLNLQNITSTTENLIIDEHDKTRLAKLKKKIDNHFQMLKNYRTLISTGIPEKVIFPLSEKFLEDIFNRVNIDFRNAKLNVIETQVDLLVKEIKEDYQWNVKKAILDYILKDKKQRKRLKIGINNFETIREWGERDKQCVLMQKDPMEVRQISEDKNQRNSLLMKSEAKEVLNARFSILSDGKMRKSTFSMLNKKNQEIDLSQHAILGKKKKSQFIPYEKPQFQEQKQSVHKLSKPNNRISVKFNSMKTYLNSFNAKNNIDKKVVALVHRENFKTKVEELGKKLTLFNKPMEEIQTIRNYFKYTFDRRDKIIKNNEFQLEYRHVKDLIEIPSKSYVMDWESFVDGNLSRIRSFRTHVIQKWMEEISNVYQTFVLGKMSKVEALRFFDSVTGILSIDLREVILHCLNKLSTFFKQFEKTILSPKRAVKNIKDKNPIMPKSYFKLTLQILNGSDEIEDR